jgi:hypothetical protein
MAGQIDLDQSAMHDFNTMLAACTYPAVCSREYILPSKLTDWLKSETSYGPGTTQVARLLRYAYYKKSSVGLPVREDRIHSGPKPSLLVFSILLKIGCGHLLHHWRQKDIVDQSLPIPLYSLQKLVERMDIPNVDKDDITNNFDRAQWRFCPAKFELGDDIDYINKDRIIPICRKKLINDKGGTAELFQIAVQEEFVGKRLREAVSSSRFDDRKSGLGVVSQCTPPQSQQALVAGSFTEPILTVLWCTLHSAMSLP